MATTSTEREPSRDPERDPVVDGIKGDLADAEMRLSLSENRTTAFIRNDTGGYRIELQNKLQDGELTEEKLLAAVIKEISESGVKSMTLEAHGKSEDLPLTDEQKKDPSIILGAIPDVLPFEDDNLKEYVKVLLEGVEPVEYSTLPSATEHLASFSTPEGYQESDRRMQIDCAELYARQEAQGKPHKLCVQYRAGDGDEIKTITVDESSRQKMERLQEGLSKLLQSAQIVRGADLVEQLVAEAHMPFVKEPKEAQGHIRVIDGINVKAYTKNEPGSGKYSFVVAKRDPNDQDGSEIVSLPALTIDEYKRALAFVTPLQNYPNATLKPLIGKLEELKAEFAEARESTADIDNAEVTEATEPTSTAAPENEAKQPEVVAASDSTSEATDATEDNIVTESDNGPANKTEWPKETVGERTMPTNPEPDKQGKREVSGLGNIGELMKKAELPAGSAEVDVPAEPAPNATEAKKATDTGGPTATNKEKNDKAQKPAHNQCEIKRDGEQLFVRAVSSAGARLEFRTSARMYASKVNEYEQNLERALADSPDALFRAVYDINDRYVEWKKGKNYISFARPTGACYQEDDKNTIISARNPEPIIELGTDAKSGISPDGFSAGADRNGNKFPGWLGRRIQENSKLQHNGLKIQTRDPNDTELREELLQKYDAAVLKGDKGVIELMRSYRDDPRVAFFSNETELAPREKPEVKSSSPKVSQEEILSALQENFEQRFVANSILVDKERINAGTQGRVRMNARPNEADSNLSDIALTIGESGSDALRIEMKELSLLQIQKIAGFTSEAEMPTEEIASGLAALAEELEISNVTQEKIEQKAAKGEKNDAAKESSVVKENSAAEGEQDTGEEIASTTGLTPGGVRVPKANGRIAMSIDDEGVLEAVIKNYGKEQVKIRVTGVTAEQVEDRASQEYFKKVPVAALQQFFIAGLRASGVKDDQITITPLNERAEQKKGPFAKVTLGKEGQLTATAELEDGRRLKLQTNSERFGEDAMKGLYDYLDEATKAGDLPAELMKLLESGNQNVDWRIAKGKNFSKKMNAEEAIAALKQVKIDPSDKPEDSGELSDKQEPKQKKAKEKISAEDSGDATQVEPSEQAKDPEVKKAKEPQVKKAKAEPNDDQNDDAGKAADPASPEAEISPRVQELMEQIAAENERKERLDAMEARLDRLEAHIARLEAQQERLKAAIAGRDQELDRLMSNLGLGEETPGEAGASTETAEANSNTEATPEEEPAEETEEGPKVRESAETAVVKELETLAKSLGDSIAKIEIVELRSAENPDQVFETIQLTHENGDIMQIISDEQGENVLQARIGHDGAMVSDYNSFDKTAADLKESMQAFAAAPNYAFEANKQIALTRQALHEARMAASGQATNDDQDEGSENAA